MSDVKVNKKVFEVEIGEGEALRKVEYAVKRPDQKLQQQAQSVYNRAFRDAVKPSNGERGAIVRAALDGVLRDQKLWDDAKQEEAERIGKALREGEAKLTKGGVKLSEGRDIAIQMRRDRNAWQRLQGDRNALDVNTAEAQAENAKFNFLVASCTVDPKTGARYFKDEEDYNTKSADPVAFGAANALAELIYEIDPEFFLKFPEEKWLRAYEFTDKEGNLVNKAGERVDAKGRRIDADGYLLSEDNKRIDEEGNLLGTAGEILVINPMPFLDDETGVAVTVANPLVTPAKAPVEEAKEKPIKVEAELAVTPA